jgi:FkbM family methyltransferase
MNIRKQLPHFSKRPLLVSAHAYRRYWTRSLGYIHSDMSVAIDLYVKPGAIVWDIGANMGVFAFLSALRAGSTGRVYAFEAYVECATLITRSKKWRQPDEAEVVICPFALSEETGTLAFQVSSYRSAASAIQGFGRFGFGGTVREVPTLTVDDLAERFVPPTIIKIDVEGAGLAIRCSVIVLSYCSKPRVVRLVRRRKSFFGQWGTNGSRGWPKAPFFRGICPPEIRWQCSYDIGSESWAVRLSCTWYCKAV